MSKINNILKKLNVVFFISKKANSRVCEVNYYAIWIIDIATAIISAKTES